MVLSTARPVRSALLAVLALLGCSEPAQEFQTYQDAGADAVSPATEKPADVPSDASPAAADTATETVAAEASTSTESAEPEVAETTAPEPAEPAAQADADPVVATPDEPVVAQLPTNSPAANAQPAATDPATAANAVASVDPGAQAIAAAPLIPKVLVPNRDFRVEGPEDAIRVSYDDLDLLKVLNLEPVTPKGLELMPEWLRALNGRRIRIRGFMYPPTESIGITAFSLARDNQICCFGRNPKIYDLFPVVMRPGQTTEYILNRPFDVVGVFHIEPDADGEELFQLYYIDDAVIIQ